MIDWKSEESHVLINPKWPDWKKQLIAPFTEDLLKHKALVWAATSGSSSTGLEIKFVGLSKAAFIVSAQAVNEHIKSTSKDKWLKVLPSFHVGGLAIYARAQLSGAEVIDIKNFKWNVCEFLNLIKKHRPSLISLVPSQVYDLVAQQLKPTEDVRLVFVGGGSLSQELYTKAVELGWPILLTYGMTETCSQIATTELSSVGSLTKPSAKILTHMNVKCQQGEPIFVKSKSLLDMYFCVKQNNEGVVTGEYISHKKDSWFDTGDLGSVDADGYLSVKGRKSDVVKVLGELVNLSHLNSILALCAVDGVVVSTPDKRSENCLSMVLHKKEIMSVGKILDLYNQKVAPFERVHSVYYVEAIDRTELGKVKTQELISKLY